MKKNYLNQPFTLPCGIRVKNRLVKSAMTERISNRKLEPTQGHAILYKQWAETDAGILITGNIMVDNIHLESTGNVYLRNKEMLEKVHPWIEASRSRGNHIWAQISHAGRQTSILNAWRPKAPSAIRLKKLGLFNKPKALTKDEILDIIDRYVETASLCKQAGFTGIQIHAAHGYLLSQFLSPMTNKRKDEYGGAIENRSRVLFEIIRRIRKEVGSQFPISVKLNSSDFQYGGFTENESLEVIKRLDKAGIDLLEISGGTYEKIVFLMMNEKGPTTSERTKRREAYFIDFAKKVREVTQMPLMITGGFRSYTFCNTCLQNEELDFIGMARPFITNLEDIQAFLKGSIETLDNFVIRTNFKALNDMAEAGNYALQIIRMSKGKSYKNNIGPLRSAIYFLIVEVVKGLKKMV